MTYRELLEQYKKGKLDEKAQAEIAAELEKHEAISEYLCENEEIPELDSLGDELLADEMKQESAEFSAMIHASIRKAFIKAGFIIGSISICIALGVAFGLPKLIDKLYYDPTVIAGTSQDGVAAQQLQLDLTVYSELFLPQQYCLDAYTSDNGYGKYDVMVHQTQSFTGEFPKAAGVIKRNKLMMYDPNFFCYSPINGFAMREIGVNAIIAPGQGASGSPEDAFADLQELDETKYYHAQFTLDRVHSYKEYVEWCTKAEVSPHWNALCYWDDASSQYTTYGNLLGFRSVANSIGFSFDQKKYPYLTLFSLSDVDDDNAFVNEEIQKQHVLSMLRYMQDEPCFYEMMQERKPDDLHNWETSIEENGLYLYGFTVTAQKKELLRIAALDRITYVHTEPVQ